MAAGQDCGPQETGRFGWSGSEFVITRLHRCVLAPTVTPSYLTGIAMTNWGPVVGTETGCGLEIVDGNHRLAAIVHLGLADRFNLPIWIAH